MKPHRYAFLALFALLVSCAGTDSGTSVQESAPALGVTFDSSSTQVSHVDLAIAWPGSSVRYDLATVTLDSAPWGVGTTRRWEEQVHLLPASGWSTDDEFWYDFWLLDMFSIHRANLRNPAMLSSHDPGALFDDLGSDSFTYYVTPSQVSAFEDALAGVNPDTVMGIVFSPFHTDTLVVGNLAPNGVAKAAGVLRKDRLLSVNGSSADPDSVLARLSALPGSATVALTVRHPSGDTATYSMVRKPAWFQPVWFDTLEGGNGYIRIDQFVADTTGPEVVEAVAALTGVVGSTGWILLDLRDNPGGEIETAVQTAQALLPAGDTLIRIRSRSEDTLLHAYEGYRTYSYQGTTAEQWRVNASGTALTNPRIVVLADGGTASAAELVLSALRENLLPSGCLRQVGSRTFGKGIGQSILSTPAGGLARITSLEILPVHAQSYNAVGLAPTVEVADSLALATALSGLSSAAGRASGSRAVLSDRRIAAANRRTSLSPTGYLRRKSPLVRSVSGD